MSAAWCWAQLLGQPLTCTRSEPLRASAGLAAMRTPATGAALMASADRRAGAGPHVDRRVGAGQAQARRRRAPRPARRPGRRARRGTARSGCGSCRGGRRRQRARSASTRSSSPVRSPSGTFTVTRARPGVRCGRTPALQPPSGPVRQDLGEPQPIGDLDRLGLERRRRSQPGEPLASRGPEGASAPCASMTNFMRPLLGVVQVAQVDEGLGERQGGRQDVAAGDEVGQRHAHERRRPQAAARPQPVAGLAVHDDRLEPAVVEPGVVGAGGAAAEGQVDPAGQDDVQLGGAATTAAGHGPGVGPAVEGLVEADAGVGAGHHVAVGVPARRPVGEAEGVAGGEHGGHGPGRHVVQLEALAGGDVDPALAVGVGERGHRPGLRRADPPAGHADADHEDAGLRLGADPVGLEGVAVLGVSHPSPSAARRARSAGRPARLTAGMSGAAAMPPSQQTGLFPRVSPPRRACDALLTAGATTAPGRFHAPVTVRRPARPRRTPGTGRAAPTRRSGGAGGAAGPAAARRRARPAWRSSPGAAAPRR